MTSSRLGSNSFRYATFLRVLLLLLPVSIGWIVFGGAVTQDGPSHLAAAKIADEWLENRWRGTHESSVSTHYELHPELLPNWGGQALGMAVVRALPARAGEIALNLAGLWFPAMTLIWLADSVRRNRANGHLYETPESDGSWTTALIISLAAMNALWTFGFSSFLLGLGTCWIFLGLLRSYARHGGAGLWCVLSTAWCVLFLCHLVAFAIGGIVAVCLILQASEWSLGRRARVMASLACGLPLVINYRRLTAGNRIEPIWDHFEASQWLSPANWVRQLGWVDPISLHSKTWHPLFETGGAMAIALQPVTWVGLALFVLGWCAMKHLTDRPKPSGEALGWQSAAFVLALLGIFGPDSLGPQQGHYLPQRFCLAAISLTAILIASAPRRSSRSAVACLATAWALQSIAAIDFARKSEALTQPVRSAYAFISPGDRVVGLIDATSWQYRANPRLHADALLVMAAEDVVSWNLYEAAHPYFPLRFRESPAGLEAAGLENFSLRTTGNDDETSRKEIVTILELLDDHAEVLAVLMGRDSPRRMIIDQEMKKMTSWRLAQDSPELAIYVAETRGIP